MLTKKDRNNLASILAAVIGTTVVATLAVITAIASISYILYKKYQKLKELRFETGNLEELEDDMSDEIYDDDEVNTVLVHHDKKPDKREKLRRKANQQPRG